MAGLKFVVKYAASFCMTLMLVTTTPVLSERNTGYSGGLNNYPRTIPEVLDKISEKLNAFEVLKRHEVFSSGIGNEFWIDIEKLLATLKDSLNGTTLTAANHNCILDFIWSLKQFLHKQPWAITMFDSYGKLGSGLTEGNTRWPGSFSLCRSVKETKESALEPDRLFTGQYCWAAFQLKPAATETFTNFSYVPPLQAAICVPNSCSVETLNETFSNGFFVKTLNKYLQFAGVSCIPEEHNFWADKKAITCFVIFLIFATILFAGTMYDAYLCLFSSRKTNIPYQKMDEPHEVTINSVKEGSSDDVIKSDIITHNHNSNTHVNNENLAVDVVQPNNNILGDILLAFSVYTNGKKIFSITPSKETLAPLNGIRFFSMTWVILGHTYLFGAVMTDNMLVLVDVVKSLAFQLVAQGTMSVDSFFVLSGLLLTYLYLKEHEKMNGKINWIKFYIHRFWRLTPPYILVMFLICDGTAKYWSNGPFWPQDGFEKDRCTKSWWWNMLYINNFQPVKDMCMGHTWYLANDMQFYIISPLILIPLTRFFPLAAAAGGTFMIAQWIATGLIASHNKIGAAIDLEVLAPGSTKYGVMFDHIYDKPYCRIAPYIVGMACGWLLYKTKCKAQIRRHWVILGWLLATACNLSVVFGLYHNSPGIPVSALYLSLSRTAWAVGLSWVIFACCNGYGGVVNHILSWPAWNPLSRLTYCAYLWHLTLIYTIIYSSDLMGHFSHTTMIYYYIANVIVAYAGALLLSLAFESPMLGIEKLILPRSRS